MLEPICYQSIMFTYSPHITKSTKASLRPLDSLNNIEKKELC